MLTVCLVTLGDPATLTGGYRYHRRMAELAGRNDARVGFVSLPLRLPALYGYRALRAARADVVLVDSIAAAFLAPWILLRRPRRLAAVVHQPPGWIDHAALRKWIQARLDRLLYRDGTLRLHLAGDEQAGTRYHDRVIGRLGELHDRVIRHGPCDETEIGRLCRSAEFFVLPSRWETYGTVYAEALTAGLPVVGWRSGNVPHLVTDGREGLTAAPGDARALAGALGRVAADEPARRRMAAAAARRAQSLAIWEQSAQRFFAALRCRP